MHAVQSGMKGGTMEFISWNGKMYPADNVKIDGYRLGLTTVSTWLKNRTITHYATRGGYLNFYTNSDKGKLIK